MKKLAIIFITLSLSCQAFTKPLCEEDHKLLWYRQLYLESCVYDLNDLKQECDQNGWNKDTSKELERVINKMKWALAFPDQ